MIVAGSRMTSNLVTARLLNPGIKLSSLTSEEKNSVGHLGPKMAQKDFRSRTGIPSKSGASRSG